MATTYVLIASNVLSGTATSVTFSSIPSTYTDLIVSGSTRDNSGAGGNGYLTLRFNNDSGSFYSDTYMRGNSATAGSAIITAAANLTFNAGDGSGATANVFGTFEFYIPNYAGTRNKVLSSDDISENNAATANTAMIMAGAHFYQTSSAISTITIYPVNTTSFVAGSSFYLYGIKNS